MDWKKSEKKLRPWLEGQGIPWPDLHHDEWPHPRCLLTIDAEEMFFFTALLSGDEVKLLLTISYLSGRHSDWPERYLPFVTKVRRKYKRYGVRGALRADVLSAGCCALCSSTERLEVDHIIPVSKGGTNERSNLQALCERCNIVKGDN